MAIGRIRAALIIVLFASSASIPILMETSVAPLMNMLTFLEQFYDIGPDGELVLKLDALLSVLDEDGIRCLTGESDETQTVLQITLTVSNTDPMFDILIPGLDITIYWKAGLPYEREKEAVLGNWTRAAINDPNPHREPVYDSRRWTRVLGITSDGTRVNPGEKEYLVLKIYLYNDQPWNNGTGRGKSNALGQMIGTMLRTMSTEDPYTGEALMHLSGSASIGPILSFPLDLPLGIDLSGFLNFTQLLSGLGGESGNGGGIETPNLFELLFDVPLNIFDIQNYNDTDGNFVRDYSGIINETGIKNWTEELYQNGALSAFAYMDLKDQLGIQDLNITFLQSIHNPDDANITRTWYPEINNEPVDEDLITNQIFLYLPNSTSLKNSAWANKIFALMGFTSDQRLTESELEVGQLKMGGTLRLTGDLRNNSDFGVGDGIGALLTQAAGDILPLGIFGSLDLMLNNMPLSICLDIPLEINISSLLGQVMGGEEVGEGGGDIFSVLMDYVGLEEMVINGLAFDTFESLLQLNFTTNHDMFLPYGIYMPSEVTYDANGSAIPYIGVGGGPLQLFYGELPANWDNRSESEKDEWRHNNLIMNISSLDSETLKESMAKLMATIGSTDQGDGMAYMFEDGLSSNENHGDLEWFLAANGRLPNADEDKSNFQLNEDEFMLDLDEIVPDFGNGLENITKDMGIDPLFIEYLNNSIDHDNQKSILEDLLSIRQMLDLLYKNGTKNDIFDYLLDANISNIFTVGLWFNPYWNGTHWVNESQYYENDFNASYFETAEIIDANTLRVEHDGVEDIVMIFNGTRNETDGSWINPHSWWDVNHTTKSFTSNGLINIDTSQWNDSFLESGSIQVMYITNKLALLDLSNLLGALLNLTFGTGDGGGAIVSEEMASTILRYLPGALDAMGIDFDRIMPKLIKYLQVNLSDPVKGFGIKPFEMLDVAFHSMSEGGSNLMGDLLGGVSPEFIDNLMDQVVKRFIEQADPFQFMNAAIGDLTPLLDYLSRSKLFSREVLVPLVASLFPSGAELEFGEEALAIEDLLDIIMPLVSEMLVGGGEAAFDHPALNPFAWLTAPECIELVPTKAHIDEIFGQTLPIYQVGFGNYTPDYPKYDNLRLMSNLTLGLLMSGFTARDLWEIIDILKLIDLSGGDDPLNALGSILPLMGGFVPPTEWDALLREIGIWSTWSGELDLAITVMGITLNLGSLLGPIMDMEKLLATGHIQGLYDIIDFELTQLCLYENQSYGNPYAYIPGYDSSYNTGPYRDMDACDNWGWCPLGWDPGGFPPSFMGGSGYGEPPDYIPAGGGDYNKSFLSKLVSTVPVELDIDVPEFDFDMSFPIWIITINIDLFMPVQLFMRFRLEGNPSQLAGLFEEQGIPLMGLGGHFFGGDLPLLVQELLDALARGGTGDNETFEFPELDLLVLLESFLNADLDILHYWKYLVDPEFMKASDWYLDSGYINMSADEQSLIWDSTPIGDNDEIPDEYPWYRFLIPIYNQINPDLGPGTPDGRNPRLLDLLTPAGPPGSGLWSEEPDGVPDGLQHYWFDTPYAYVNTTVRENDTWLYYDPYDWNDPVSGPLLKNVSDAAWDDTHIPSLYYVPQGSTPGQVGNARTPDGATYPDNFPLPPFDSTDLTPFPNIWLCFNETLIQTDYRFGHWDQRYDDTLGKTIEFLNISMFYDLLSYAMYPQLNDLLDMIDISALFGTGTTTPEDLLSLGDDYYHQIMHNDVYSQFGIDENQPLCIFGLLQWLWDGAGLRYNGSQSVPYIEPYTVPNLEGALDWLADHGFTIDFIIKNLGQITEILAAEIEGDGGSDIMDMFSIDSIVGMMNSIEEYMIKVVANGSRENATRITLNILKDMTTILDIYPIKAIRGVLNYLMPRVSEITGGTGGDGSQLALGTFLDQSGLIDIVFEDISKMNNLNFTMTIHQSSIDLYLFGQLIEDIPLDLEIQFNLADLLGGAEDGAGGGESSGTDMLNNLPISFPAGGFPYIELSTFNGPFDIEFHLFNTTIGSPGTNDVTDTYVTIGEIWYNETTGLYYFNRTQSSYENGMGISGWINNRTYVRPILKRSDSQGRVNYSSVIEKDSFGWVDPFIYIHVEQPFNYPLNTFYWWNVTGIPRQRTLAGNTPAYKASWIENGEQIIVQSVNTLPVDSINIDDDSYLEIFARVEIDAKYMGTQKVVYVRRGNIQDDQVHVFNITGYEAPPAEVLINASYSETTQQWPISTYTTATKYIIDEDITPTGKRATYPTISEVISGFHLNTNNWNDDSIYQLIVSSVNLTGEMITLYNFTLARALGNDTSSSTPVVVPGGFQWTPAVPAGEKTLTCQFSPQLSAEAFNGGGNSFLYSEIDIDANNFTEKTISSVILDLNVTNYPDGNQWWWQTFVADDLSYGMPADNRTHTFVRDFSVAGLVMDGEDNPLQDKNAQYAWFNYTASLGPAAFLNEINWDIRAEETSVAKVDRILVRVHDASSGAWTTVYDDTIDADTKSGTIDEFSDLSNNLGKTGGEDLYLTSRNLTLFENYDIVQFAARVKEPGAGAGDGIGYINDATVTNTTAWISFRYYPFVSDWGVESLGAPIEIPGGFVSDFRVSIDMYDPLGGIDTLVRPNVSVSYYTMGPLKSDANIDNESIFAQKVSVYLEAWDSLVREDGEYGDILWKDNETGGYGSPMKPLDDLPTLNTTIEVIDLEAKVNITVTIDADQTLRNYYLHMNVSSMLGYEALDYTTDYRFNIRTSNADALRKMGAYPSKKVMNTSLAGWKSIRVGLVDLEPYSQQYVLEYILTFEVSPEFIVNPAAQINFAFNAVWETAEGTYEVRPTDKMETNTKDIDIVYI
ncbi:MAG: hypothetical protein HWN66_03285 [Candidatus Helarchaeota archaeon]|nr:hypothetical protein [Candidatus Helarchaeota archaeon]